MSELVHFRSRCRKSVIETFEGHYMLLRAPCHSTFESGLWSTLLARLLETWDPGSNYWNTKHQASRVSKPMLLCSKFRSVKVEFCSSASAKAWHGDKWLQKHEACIIKISKTKFQAAKPDQTMRFMTGGSSMIHDASYMMHHDALFVSVLPSSLSYWL